MVTRSSLLRPFEATSHAVGLCLLEQSPSANPRPGSKLQTDLVRSPRAFITLMVRSGPQRKVKVE